MVLGIILDARQQFTLHEGGHHPYWAWEWDPLIIPGGYHHHHHHGNSLTHYLRWSDAKIGSLLKLSPGSVQAFGSLHIKVTFLTQIETEDQHLQKFCKSLMSKIMEYNHQGFASAQIFVRAVCQVRRRRPMTSSVCWEKARVLRSDRLQTNCQCSTKTPKNSQYSPPPPKMPEENKTYRNLRPGGE